jgi:two-component SAPR family response regulator
MVMAAEPRASSNVGDDRRALSAPLLCLLRETPLMPDAGPLKVLVVEDESLVALDIETMLEEMGCKVVASVPRLVKALDLASRLDLDLAVLDINLAGEVVYPLAFRLAARGIPFLFSTGYSTADLPPELRDRPILRKPVMLANLKRAVAMARTGIRSVN